MSGVNRRYFDNLLKDKDMSLRALAAEMGLGHSQLSLTFSGARRMQIDEAAQIAKIFGQPLQTVIENMGVKVASSSIAIIGALGGDGTVTTFPKKSIERIAAPAGAAPGMVAIQSRTADTPLAWLDGAIFFLVPHNNVGPGSIGRLCFAKITGGDTVIAHIRRGYKNDSMNLSGPYAQDSVRLDWASPIIEIRT